MSTKTSTRNYALDWLRVLLILTVFVYHSTRAFDMDDWQIKNATTYFGVEGIGALIGTWMMPAIFMVSGAAVFYALGKRGAGRFIQERALRLLVPLVVALFAHLSLQAYLEQINHGHPVGSFWQWYPGYLRSVGADIGRAWQGYHLWYLEMLFVLSLVCLPLFLWLRQGSGASLLAWLGEHLSMSSSIYVPMILVMLPTALLDPRSGFLANYMSTGGWNTPTYLVFFLAGFLVGSSQGMQERIRRLRWISLASAVLTILAYFHLFLVAGRAEPGTPGYTLVYLTRSISSWCWMVALLGFGLQRLTARTPFLDYANEAVMPFYILHQSALVILGFFVVGWPIPDLLKWGIIALTSFAVIMASYEYLVRRNNVLRILFGMKPLAKAQRRALSTVASPKALV